MLVKTYGSAVYGLNAQRITLEVNLTPGMHYYIVGLADGAVKESLRRVESALKMNGYHMPRTKLVVNMAPADLRKSGTAFDLPIAMGVLGASEQLEDLSLLEDYTMMGELSLDGTLRPIRGVMIMAEQAVRDRFKGLIVPLENAQEAAEVGTIPVFGVRHILEVVGLVSQKVAGAERAAVLPPFVSAPREYPLLAVQPSEVPGVPADPSRLDFLHVKGQLHAKRALEIAAAGSHNVLLIGAPGSGKTMLARLLPDILPPLTREEAMEIAKIQSISGRLATGSPLTSARPFRSPHHSISSAALVGGNTPPQPGEVSLSHNGVLFLDELPEFPKRALEYLREPMEDGVVSISRVAGTLAFPARFMMVAAMNPCPCGYHTHPTRDCTCPKSVVQRYLSRISGPLLDRIDLHVEVNPPGFSILSGDTGTEALDSSAVIRHRVVQARSRQTERFTGCPGVFGNAHMNAAQVRNYCALPPGSKALLRTVMEKLHLSARAYDRICKVALTIADLAGEEAIQTEHIAEALQYRSLDREDWAG